MVAANLEYALQLARSMGVGVILANQSMEDLEMGLACALGHIPPSTSVEMGCYPKGDVPGVQLGISPDP